MWIVDCENRRNGRNRRMVGKLRRDKLSKEVRCVRLWDNDSC